MVIVVSHKLFPHQAQTVVKSITFAVGHPSVQHSMPCISIHDVISPEQLVQKQSNIVCRSRQVASCEGVGAAIVVQIVIANLVSRPLVHTLLGIGVGHLRVVRALSLKIETCVFELLP